VIHGNLVRVVVELIPYWRIKLPHVHGKVFFTDDRPRLSRLWLQIGNF
jgi:hypothetical protein